LQSGGPISFAGYLAFCNVNFLNKRLGLEDAAQDEQQTLPAGSEALQNCGLGCKTQHRRGSRSFLQGVKQGPTWVVQAVPSEVQSGDGCVEEDEVSNGLCTFILSHLAPTHLQHLNLRKPACPKSATTHDYSQQQLMITHQQQLMITSISLAQCT
jgi:hypothetical protein